MNSIALLLYTLKFLIWPLTICLIVFYFRNSIKLILIAVSNGFQVKVKSLEFTIAPTKSMRLIDANSNKSIVEEIKLPNLSTNVLPTDYVYINHISFLKPEKQEEYKSITKVDLPHYNIHVIVDSYYEGAMARIKYVEYILHQSYPHPIQRKYNSSEKFLLKELANGEYVLIAKVFLEDILEPIVLERYITLWTSGPNLL